MKLFELFEAKSLFRYVYHITTKENLTKIKQQGLIPTTHSSGKGWQHLKYDRPSIFVVTRNTRSVLNELIGMIAQKEQTEYSEWGDNEWDQFYDTHCLITIDLSKCSDVELHNDPSAGHWLHSKVLSGTIPPESIVNVEAIRYAPEQ